MSAPPLLPPLLLPAAVIPAAPLRGRRGFAQQPVGPEPALPLHLHLAPQLQLEAEELLQHRPRGLRHVDLQRWGGRAQGSQDGVDKMAVITIYTAQKKLREHLIVTV